MAVAAHAASPPGSPGTTPQPEAVTLENELAKGNHGQLEAHAPGRAGRKGRLFRFLSQAGAVAGSQVACRLTGFSACLTL
jgi:hypothetical protein